MPIVSNLHKFKHVISRKALVVAGVSVGIVAITSVFVSAYANNPFASLQSEIGSRTGNVALASDTSASGSSAVKFGTAASACVGAANTPGGPDPWGGCWPGPQNTGYPKGLPGDVRTPVTLTNYTGPQVITSCGVVIDKKITPWLNINVGNGTHSKDTPCVTIKNSWVKGIVFSDDSSYGPVLIEDTEIDSDGDLPYAENAGRYNYFVYRVNSHGGQGVIKCAAYCETKDNWIHGMTLGGAYHYNAIGGNGMEAGAWNIEHNWAECGDWESVDASFDPSGAGCSSVIGFYGDFAPIRNITINRNFMKSAYTLSTGAAPNQYAQAGFCLNPGYYGGKPYPNPTNMTITDNVFARSLSGTCAIFGPSNDINRVGMGSTNTWSGNKYEDGTVISRPEAP